MHLSGKNKPLNEPSLHRKITLYFSKAFEDGYIYEYDYLLDLNADYESLMTDNPQNTSNKITVGTAFELAVPSETRACFVDTPGANFQWMLLIRRFVIELYLRKIRYARLCLFCWNNWN